MIDLSDRIIQKPTSLRAPNGGVKWHPWRRAAQLLCGVLLVVLPLTNGLRLDVRRDEFFFAGHRTAAHDLLLLFWVSMLGVWALATVSFLYGRLWCGWVCPQTLASDFADSLKSRLQKAFRRRSSGSLLAARSVWAAAVCAMALATGVVLASYWLAPPTVLAATARPWADWPAGLTVYGIAAVLAADMLWVRRKFCAHACPYGALMSSLADRSTLAVRYLDERDDDCIRCGKCVTDCPMGIDIKKGVGQVDCIGCGECVDACNDVLGRRGKPGLIEFRYGTGPERVTAQLSPAQRWGLWDSRRVGAVLTLIACLGVVLWSVYGRVPLAASVLANGAMTRDAHAVRNTYALTVANGTPDDQTFTISVEGLPQARIEPAPVLCVGRRDSRTALITLLAPSDALAPGRRIPVRLRVQSGGQQAVVRTFFYAPIQ